MITQLRHFWQEMRSSFWFVPAAIVVAAVGLATALVAVDASIQTHFDQRWPLVFGAGAEGSRGLLSAVAGSMITVAGVVFSITIVALALTSSQYTSRVLRNFMRDRVNQSVLGVFVGIFAYCLVVLRTIRGGDETTFVPSLAVLGGLILAFVGIGMLIYFIHHISMAIQASNIIATAARETITAVDHLFPTGLGDDADDDDHSGLAALGERPWSVVPAQKTGYIEGIDGDALLALARDLGTVLRMERGIGEFVVDGTPLLSVARTDPLDQKQATGLNAAYFISRQRTLHQDAAFGIRQIVDIALKALSPGINDSTTALMCVDYLTAILVRLAPRRIASPHRLDDGELRLISRGRNFVGLLAESFDQIRQNAEGNSAILTRIPQALATIAAQTASPRRRQAIRQQGELIRAASERSIVSPYDRAGVDDALVKLHLVLDGLVA
jgi:uncharacterized membrane protein